MKHLIVAAVAVIAVVLLVFLIRLTWNRLYFQNERLTLKQLKFNGTQHYSPDTRNGHISIATILSENGIELGKANLLALDLNKVQAILSKHPLLTHVKVSKVLPDTLEIQAIERIPVAVLCPYNGTSMAASFPIAEKKLRDDPTRSPAAVLLPPSLNLYDSRNETTVPWNYVVYPKPFNKDVINTNLPYLFGFQMTQGNPEAGQVEANERLAAALKLIKLAGVTSSNQYFDIRQIKLKAADTLRVTVMPTPQSKLVKKYACFDFSVATVNEKTVRNVQNYLQVLEKSPKRNVINYLNATGTNIYSSPESPRN